MTALLKTPVTVVWALLVSATVVSWALGADHGIAVGSQRAASVLVIAIAFIKVRFVGLYFMEVRDAPVPLRVALEVYCIAVCSLVIGMFLFA